MRALTRGLCGLLTIVVLFGLCTAASAMALVVRNGGFDAGLTGWRIATVTGYWDGLVTDESGNACINLMSPGYGPILTQSLNITDVADREFTVNADLKRDGDWIGGDLEIYLVYVDTSGHLQRIMALTSMSSGIMMDSWTRVTGSVTLPSDARKVVAISLDSTGWANLFADNICLSAPGAVVGPVAEITGISPSSGPYGTTVTITGSNFGADSTGAEVRINGSTDGISASSWSDTSIEVSVNDPAVTGRVDIARGAVESSGDFTYTVTSPRYLISVLNPYQQALKGDAARYVVRLDGFNGYESTAGVTFSLADAPSGAAYTFAATPLHGQGGAELSIDTSGIAAGTYTCRVQATDGSLSPRQAEFTLKVRTVADIDWLVMDPVTGNQVPATETAMDKQGRLDIVCLITDSDGGVGALAPNLGVTSSDPTKLLACKDEDGWWEFYALENGSASFTASIPGGPSASITVKTSFPSYPSCTSISCEPSEVTNSGTPVTFTATGTEDYPLGWYHLHPQIYFSDWNYDGELYTRVAEGWIDQGREPGVCVFGWGVAEWTYPFRPTLLTIVNDPSKGQVSGRLYQMDRGGVRPDLSGTLEFWDVASGEHVFNRPLEAADYTMSYITPGTYRVKFVPNPSYALSDQWYPNANTFKDAADVIVAAGGCASDIDFFLFPRPLEIVWTEPADGAVSISSTMNILAQFNASLDFRTVSSDSFYVTDAGGNRVPGEVSGMDFMVSFFPEQPLEGGQIYRATATTALRDTNGNGLLGDYTWSFTTSTNRIAGLRSQPDGTTVNLSMKPLYYLSEDGYVGYIEEPDRSSGIRVEGLGRAYQDAMLSSISGQLATTKSGERYISLYNCRCQTSGASTTLALGANNRALRTDLMSGLKVRAWGVVKSIDAETQSYVISDGSDPDGIKVYGDCPVGVGESTVVTGAAGYDGTRVIHDSVSPTPVLTAGGPLVLKWNPRIFNYGQDVYELQVIRDQSVGNQDAFPVRVITGGGQWNLGYTNLTNLYGSGVGTPVMFSRLALGATTPTQVQWTVPAEEYGVTHAYALRALRRWQTGVDGNGFPIYGYYYNSFAGQVIATAVEPVAADHFVSPMNGEHLLISDLRRGDANLQWTPAVGADQYRVRVMPAMPGAAPSWTSSAIAFDGELGVVPLPDADRIALANLLDNPAYRDVEMRWCVDARNSGDTSPDWTTGDQSIFTILLPPGPPAP